jgi:hypothetical protein
MRELIGTPEERKFVLGCIKIATKVVGIYLGVTDAAFRPHQVGDTVMSCIKNPVMAHNVYETVMQYGPGGEDDEFLSKLNWIAFLKALAVLAYMEVTLEDIEK